MKPYQWPILILLLALVPCAHADTFDLTQMKVSFGNFTEGINTAESLLGPGTNIQAEGGFDCLGLWCESPGQFGFAPGTSLFLDIGDLFLDMTGSATVGGTKFFPPDFVFTGLSINSLGGPFVLPQGSGDGSLFTECMPAKASGPITAGVKRFCGDGTTPFARAFC